MAVQLTKVMPNLWRAVYFAENFFVFYCVYIMCIYLHISQYLVKYEYVDFHFTYFHVPNDVLVLSSFPIGEVLTLSIWTYTAGIVFDID